jgi:hypothetical protein
MMILLAVLVAVALTLVAFDVWAQASGTKGPFDLALIGTYLWVIAVALLGGAASFYQKVKAGQARWFNFAEFVGEMTTSALAGVLTFWLCEYASLNPWLQAAFIGIAGHMGSRALFMLEKMFERWAARSFGNGGGHVHAPEPAVRGTPGDER